MTGALPQAFRQQSDACAALGSPFMARLCALLADRLRPDRPLTRRLFDWPGDMTAAGDAVPLRLAGALHALVLRGHAGLTAVYPPHEAPDDALWQAIDTALDSEEGFIAPFIDRAPQTNEVRRAAVLIAAGHWLAERFTLPFVFSELGASAGLNLNWDRFALQAGQARLGSPSARVVLTPDWSGALPFAADITVAQRAGVDLAPIDLQDPEARLRLLAYLWPDQPHRRALTEAAIATSPPKPDRADAIDWLQTRLSPKPGHLHLVWSTVAWQYFPRAAQARGTRLMEEAGARATPDAPLAWLSYEADGTSPGAALTLRLWPGNRTLDLGRADFHGRWVDWRAP
ncbi:DUF2332 domain-containing protein [Pararhodobacter marinus]|uniref:DUF2332 domain-containing protein n=1 Tax=Pararhodobacter marinus TaxID=2184063 RepID=A0A2U2CGL2_9RHOB|nr:DUF2332 family protein [Pararhodobacter marinus]PWE31028.1 DUF2332 domain-containing protein [Pararhodobacter marinus]